MADQLSPLLLPARALGDDRMYFFDFSAFPEVQGGTVIVTSASITIAPGTGLTITEGTIGGNVLMIRLTSSLAGNYTLWIEATTSAGDVLTGYSALDVCAAPNPT